MSQTHSSTFDSGVQDSAAQFRAHRTRALSRKQGLCAANARVRTHRSSRIPYVPRSLPFRKGHSSLRPCGRRCEGTSRACCTRAWTSTGTSRAQTRRELECVQERMHAAADTAGGGGEHEEREEHERERPRLGLPQAPDRCDLDQGACSLAQTSPSIFVRVVQVSSLSLRLLAIRLQLPILLCSLRPNLLVSHSTHPRPGLSRLTRLPRRVPLVTISMRIAPRLPGNHWSATHGCLCPCAR